LVFSSPIFLFIFLPATLLLYFLAGKAVRNLLLLVISLVFYAWGEELYVLILLASIALNYLFGLGIDFAIGRQRLWWLWGGVVGNLLLLGYFKYTGFILQNMGVENAAALTPVLPIGISFFTFQALSYLIDLYYRRVQVQKNPLNLALYISLFPQLIAGPIVRYSEVEKEIIDRTVTRSDVAEGVQQFVRGLAKKTLLADPMGLVADRVFAIPEAGLTPETAWLGAICYSLQLYFDFSAYSDMAIGLGRIFGFKFPPNFNYPYTARSVTDFWRRWHMTLSRWFRDYLYIPLGGNRHGATRTYLNLWIVFLATGIWHGAAWTFIIWGAYHGAFLIIERLGLARVLLRLPRLMQHSYLLLVVIFSSRRILRGHVFVQPWPRGRVLPARQVHRQLRPIGHGNRLGHVNRLAPLVRATLAKPHLAIDPKAQHRAGFLGVVRAFNHLSRRCILQPLHLFQVLSHAFAFICIGTFGLRFSRGIGGADNRQHP
jgi:alginate O-acetyltransferase complex protein AlgI